MSAPAAPSWRVLSADFETSAVAAAGWPPEDAPEVAFAGRSNVGKSSAINALCSRKKLARVSHTPGRTQTINFYRIRLAPVPDDATPPRALRFADLPGYGFARAPKNERERWKRMTEEYLARRGALRGVMALVDAEVGPTPLDEELLTWLSALGRRPLILATKLDKVSKSRRHTRLLEIARRLGVPPSAVTGFSAAERTGLAAAWNAIAAACALRS